MRYSGYQEKFQSNQTSKLMFLILYQLHSSYSILIILFQLTNEIANAKFNIKIKAIEAK